MGVFDYALPNELTDVLPGSIVEIPFRQKTLLGLVYATLPEEAPPSLKAVVRRISKGPLLSTEEVAWLTTTAAWYGVSSAIIAHVVLPPLQKRKLQTTDITVPSFASVKEEKKPVFVRTPHTQDILRLIETYTQSHQTVCVFVPEIFLLKKLSTAYQKQTNKTVVVWHSELTTKEAWNTWVTIRQGNATVIFTTRSGAFLPLPPNSVVLLTEEAHEEYKHSDQNPRYHVKDVMTLRQEYISTPVIYAGTVPSLDTYYGIYHGTLQYEKKLTKEERLFPHPTLPNLEIVDMHNDRRAGHYGVLSDAVKDRIMNTSGDMYLVVTRRGFMGTVGCVSCNTIRRCANCTNPLVLHDDTGELVCHYCRTRTALTPVCPTCNSPTLRYSGAGTAFVENGVRALLTNRHDVEVIRIDQDHIPVVEETSNHRIIIGTEKALPFLRHDRVTTIIYVDIDSVLHVPEFTMHERTWVDMHELAHLCPHANIVVQTFSPTHIVFSAKTEPDRFYRTELSARGELGYPPYTTLVRLLYSSPQKEEAGTKPKELITQLKPLLTEVPNPCILQGPFDLHPSFLRGEYWAGIIIKIPLGMTSTMIPQITKTLPHKGWRIDIRPMRLLSV